MSAYNTNNNTWSGITQVCAGDFIVFSIWMAISCKLKVQIQKNKNKKQSHCNKKKIFFLKKWIKIKKKTVWILFYLEMKTKWNLLIARMWKTSSGFEHRNSKNRSQLLFTNGLWSSQIFTFPSKRQCLASS